MGYTWRLYKASYTFLAVPSFKIFYWVKIVNKIYIFLKILLYPVNHKQYKSQIYWGMGDFE